MVQKDFLAVACNLCYTFQVVSKTKSSKFTCKICHEKQSIAKIYASDPLASNIRPVVQRLNLKRAQVQKENEEQVEKWLGGIDFDDLEQRTAEVHLDLITKPTGSDWKEHLNEDDVANDIDDIDDGDITPIEHSNGKFFTTIPEIVRSGRITTKVSHAAKSRVGRNRGGGARAETKTKTKKQLKPSRVNASWFEGIQKSRKQSPFLPRSMSSVTKEGLMAEETYHHRPENEEEDENSEVDVLSSLSHDFRSISSAAETVVDRDIFRDDSNNPSDDLRVLPSDNSGRFGPASNQYYPKSGESGYSGEDDESEDSSFRVSTLRVIRTAADLSRMKVSASRNNLKTGGNSRLPIEIGDDGDDGDDGDGNHDTDHGDDDDERGKSSMWAGFF